MSGRLIDRDILKMVELLEFLQAVKANVLRIDPGIKTDLNHIFFREIDTEPMMMIGTSQPV
ncbi:hypothetical protein CHINAEXTREME_19485 [Halobiforma lacisalsi AJ5]|uniref:Uncharacterized protein n=1 Tax=Natronobacterium lacisalsi AJ5 TaxID=358396 RepID=M0LVA5_NATLA|nr:hypothetical protein CHINAEXTREME_19485 [Halobiforma lacisalsi AJ5]EMA36000.1 hypothetical protein C445_04063 [Halobiforma lacisalsi AJ5]